MLIKVKYNPIKVFPSEIRGKYAFLRDVVVIIRTQNKVLYVDCAHDHLANYKPPPFLSNYSSYGNLREVIRKNSVLARSFYFSTLFY
ncbi:MAG: hypothetical protein RXQ22_05970 [Sulfolobus sp.]